VKKKKFIILGILIILFIAIVVFIVLNNKVKKLDYSINTISENKLECFDKSKKCDNATLIIIKVNEKEKYNFYVINDENNILTLLMDKNIGNNTNWSANNITCSRGPDNLISYIKELTAAWLYIESKEYIMYDSNGCYENKKENMKARIPTYEDVSKLGCEYFNKNTCPDYVTSNLGTNSSGYWLSTSVFPNDTQAAYAVYKEKNLVQPSIIDSKYYGLRLIIEVEK
jgi:hypothetical protein